MGKRGLLAAAVVLVGISLWIAARDPQPAVDEPLPAEPSAPPAAQPLAAHDGTERVVQPAPAAKQADDLAASEATIATPEGPAAPPQPGDPAPMPPPVASGPIAALKHAFETEPRDSAAQEPESRIESEFRKSDIAPGLLRSVLCRQSVCRVEVLWTPERAVAFMSAFTRLSADFQPELALDPRGNVDAQQQLQVDVYLPRR